MTSGSASAGEKPLRRVALVAGATGIVGRAITARLAASPDWEVITLSRRGTEGGTRHIALDLSNAADCNRASAELGDVTHLFYTAYVADRDLAVEARTNTAMLINLITALDLAAPGLQHVQLMQGSKWYGNHLGPYRTPAREDDPRHDRPCFYYDQQDWLTAHSANRAWSWSALRPHGVLGLAIGSPMNQLTAVALYASICRELGQPLAWPGSAAAFDCAYQFTEAAYLAGGMEWIATQPRAGNQAFNFTNGDLVRWRHLWPEIAGLFGLEPEGASDFRLTEAMADKEPVWARIRDRHGLRPLRLNQLTNWDFADFVFNCGYDQISDLTRVRNVGWCGANPSHAMYRRLIGDLRAERIIP